MKSKNPEINWSELLQISKNIKLAFKIIETKPWTLKEFCHELIVQAGHFTDVYLKQSVKLNKYLAEENIERLSDELCDIILNLICIAIELGFETKVIKDLEISENPQELNELTKIFDLLLVRILNISLYYDVELKSDIAKREIEEALILCTALVSIYKLDIMKFYRKMEVDSILFIKKNTDYVRKNA